MRRLMQIARDPEEFARLSRHVSIGIIVGFVIVVVLMLGNCQRSTFEFDGAWPGLVRPSSYTGENQEQHVRG